MQAKIATVLIVVGLLVGASVASAQQASVWEALDVLDRRIAGMLRVGVVHEVDHAKARLQASSQGLYLILR